jgi:hypothetical protein
MVAIGWWTTAASVPAAPTLAVANDGDGDAVTVTMSDGSGLSGTIYYRDDDDSAWTTGETWSGDGDVAQAGLDVDTWYTFVAVSASGGVPSLPSNIESVYVEVTSSDVTPSGITSLPAYYLAEMVARSSTFQSWVGATGTEAQRIATALTRIHRTVYGKPESGFVRPYAAIWDGDFETQIVSGGTRHYYGGSERGDLTLVFEAAVNSSHTATEAKDAFTNETGPVIDEVWTLAGTAGYLAITGMNRMGGAGHPAVAGKSEEVADEKYYREEWSVDYGP